MRSKLFVPAARPELFEKALATDADALSFDLEDAVPEDGKAAARSMLAEWLAGDAARSTAKTIIVRVNAPGTPHFDADIAAIREVRVDLVNLPKIDDPTALAAAAATIDVPLLVNIETPRGLRNAAAIAGAHPRVAGLQAGLNDLFASLGADRQVAATVHAALWTIRLAAAEAGVFAYDGAWPDIADADGFRTEAEMARGLGYLGKSCIHPRQIALANTVFALSATRIERARRIVAAARDAAAAGRGVFALDGEMIDRPAIAQAEALLAETGR